MNLLPQRLICYICMLITPGGYSGYSDEQMRYEFYLEDFYHTMGLKRISSNAYKDAKTALKSLCANPLWLPHRDQPITWLSSCDITDDNLVTVVVHSALGGHLLDLTEDFTRYVLADISDIKSAYGLRLYEYFRSYLFRHTHDVSLQELRDLLMIDDQSSYNKNSVFKQRILKKAIDEINKNSDINVKYDPGFKRVKNRKLHFIITSEDSPAKPDEDDLPF